MMEDNSSDDETMGSNSNGGKKQKLEEVASKPEEPKVEESTSAQVTVNEPNENTEGEQAENSESTTEPGSSTSQAPSNEVVNATASGSNIHAIFLNFTRPMLRNYRKRANPNDNDSNSSSDSDDLNFSIDSSADPEIDLMSAEDSDDDRNNSTDSDSNYQIDNTSDRDSSDSYGTDDIGNLDSEEALWLRNDNPADEEVDKEKIAVLEKPRPKHKYCLMKELMHREMGVSFPCGKSTKSDVIFEQKFYGSLHTVFRLKKLHQLNKHRGCVNAINFHPEGHLLASGSDDLNIIIWDWARNKALQTIKTGHKSNVFQSKFLHLNSRSQLNIVTCARDGQVRLVQCPPSGGGATRRRLGAHSRAAHKLHVSPLEPHAVLSAGEDGLVMCVDVRDYHANRLFVVKDGPLTVPLYSVHGHPLDARRLAVAGRDQFVREYDRRHATRPLRLYCPAAFKDDVNSQKKLMRISMMHLTCAVYNHDGTQILGSYNDEDIYLFDTKDDVYEKDTTRDGYTQRYSGHKNSATFKGVSFFGPRSEFVVSGSDCAHLYAWERVGAALAQWAHADAGGVVNCIETHPRFPVLATSGLDKDIKIWMPLSDSDPDFKGLEMVVRQNSILHSQSPLFSDFLPHFYNAYNERSIEGSRSNEINLRNYDLDGNVCAAF